MPPILPNHLLSCSKLLHFRLRFLLLYSFPLLAANAIAQSTDIAITPTVLQPSVKRLGINLGTMTFYDSGQMTQNLLMQNPGFEGQIWNSTIRCASGTPVTCVDEDVWSGWPAGFWNGATFEVFYGAAAGRTGTVVSSTAPGGGRGLTLNFSTSGVAPAGGDYLIVRKTVPGGSTGGWWPTTTGAGTLTDNLTDLPPGTLGKQTVALTAPGPSDSATLSGFFDSTIGKTFVQLNGTYQLQFKAKGTGGSNRINVSISRQHLSPYLSQLVALTNRWSVYTFKMTAAEDGSAIGVVGVVFSTVGADSFELDDVSFTKMSGDPTNTSAFRDPVVNALRTLQPGLLRYWAGGGQLGETLDNLIAPPFGRQRAGFSTWVTESDQISYGLHDFLVLCQLVAAEPWFVVPTAFTTTEAANLIEYLAGDNTTPYGAKRAALGQSVAWTQVFPKIHLEFGNEEWNSTFKGGNIEYSAPYGSRAQTIFAAMRNHPAYVPANFDLVLGGQAAYAGRNADIQNNCNNNDSFTVAPYTMNTVDSFNESESLFGSTFAEPEAFVSSSGTAEGLTPGMIYQDYEAIQSSSHPVPLSFYEVNLSTLAGSITQQALNSYVSSLGAGLMVADTMLQGLRQYGVVNQMLFSLPQYYFNRPDGKSVYMWGSVLDMGVTDRKRPQYLAVELANQALSNGAALLQTVHSGADPTWDQPMVNTVKLNGAHYLQSFAFGQGSNRSAILFNLHRSAALPVTFSDVDAPGGTVQMQQLTSANLTDTNETASAVNIAASTLNSFNPAGGLSLPPHSMTVLTWLASATTSQPPIISAVNAGNITSNSATITWTTDQPSSSQLRYGTTTVYGSSSALSSNLVTSHSVTLTGLTPGTIYQLVAISANASHSLAVSANFTFKTSVSTSHVPQLSYLASWGITSSGITISWSTDMPSTTAVSYGVSPALGQTTPVQTKLSNTHGVTLAGLNSGTKYYFTAQSVAANGSVGVSALQSFTTANDVAVVGKPTGPPQISYIATWSVSNTSASISWSTNMPSTTAVAYGTSPALGQTTPVQKNLATNHGATLKGLKSGTTYYFVAQSTDAGGNTASSPTQTFTTTSDDPPSLSEVVAVPGVHNTAQISWKTSIPATSYVQFGPTKAYNRFSKVTSLTTTPQPDMGWVPSGVTHYQLVSIDAKGHRTTSPDYTFIEP